MPKNKVNTFNTPSPDFKGFAKVSLLVAFSLALSGCSAKNKATNTSPSAEQQNQAYTAKSFNKPNSKVTLILSFSGGGTRAAALSYGVLQALRDTNIDLIAEISLGTFLAMSLMSMQLWTLIDLAGPIFAILAMQLLLAVIINIFIVFPSMGKTYDAAVVCAGFGGISLGSTPTAMANMSAVSQKYGHSAQAFIIVPLVCAFFIDLANALIIPYFMRMM